jgi:triacylglycerol lipase
MKRFPGLLSIFPVVPLLLASCASAAPKTIDADKEGGITAAPKYPVVLVHGIVAHDRKGPINFWGRIPKTLTEGGVQVFFGNTDSWGNYESNAGILKTTIDHILEKTGSEKVNIIAHSKGGLDSRYLIWKYNYGERVASLTTISTPHHGAEIADLIYRRKIVHSRTAKKTLEIFGRLYGDVNPDLFGVNYQLTTEKMKEFNETTGMDPRVYYQSIYTTMKNSFDDPMFFYSHWYIKSETGENDGIVSEHSATWGNNVVKIEGGISHAEIVDYKQKKISGIFIPDLYTEIVNGLAEKGF